MERVEALRAAARRLGLEITSAVVGSEQSIVEVRWFEEPRAYRTSGGFSGKDAFGRALADEHVCRGDAREGAIMPSRHLRYDFDALTGAPIGTRAPKQLADRFAELCAAVNAAHGTAVAA